MTDHGIIHTGDRVTEDDVLHIYSGIKLKTLPYTHWTHGAHLCAGTAILKDLGLEQAIEAIPDIIRRYNLSVGVKNTDTDGYHHTITLFYLKQIHELIAQWEDIDLGALATKVLSSAIAETTYPFKFYSKDLLFSVNARKNWVEGDLPQPS